MSESEVSQIECGMCGRDGGVYAECELCGGKLALNQSRAFTLTEERQGKNPDAKHRYGPTGDVSPKIVVLPGGYDPRAGTNRQQQD